MEDKMNKEIINNNFKPLCPFCGEPWSDENVQMEDTCAKATGGGPYQYRQYGRR
jgi:hypothetical protein